MEEILKLIAQHYASCLQKDELVWKIEEALDAYIDKRIDDALDREFGRGAYQSDW